MKRDLRDVLVNGSIALTADGDQYFVVYSDLLESNMLFSTQTPRRVTLEAVTPDLYLTEEKCDESRIIAVYPKSSIRVDSRSKRIMIHKDAKTSYKVDEAELEQNCSCEDCPETDCPERASTNEKVIEQFRAEAKEIGLPKILTEMLLDAIVNNK